MSTGRLITTTALLIAVMAILAVPALSGANSYRDPFSPTAVCRSAGFSHKHAKHHASPYAKCVATMRKLKKHKRLKVKTACKKYSHRHKKHHLSSYGRCVKAGKALRGR